MRFVLLLLMTFTSFGFSAEKSAEKAPHQLTFISGTVTVGDKLATIAVPEDCRYLANDDARYWVERIWGNPPDHEVIGLVVPAALEQWWLDLTKTEPEAAAPAQPTQSWGMVVSWAGDSGHVEDADAAKTDFTSLLNEMQESSKASNEERTKAGYPSVDLLGWAEPPHYDSSAKKLYWAKSLRFSGEDQPTLNYCVRILGARGVLEMNAVDNVSALPVVTAAAKNILAATEFTAGNRYADYKSGVDPLAAGGIAALIGGGLLAKKVGLLAVFGVFILKFFKILVLPLIIAGMWLKNKFSNRKAAE